MKKFAGDIIILHMCTKITIIRCTVSEIRSETGRIFCHFAPFFFPFTLPPNDSENQTFEEKKLKNALRYYPFIHSRVP